MALIEILEGLQKKSITEDEISIIIKNVEDLLMNKYIITKDDISYVSKIKMSNGLHDIVKHHIFKLFQDFSYPFDQDEYNKNAKYIPISYAQTLNLTIKDTHKKLFINKNK